MQQFALAPVSPRSIAWLIRPNEWDRFETIVFYNCAMLSGYFNVMIPLTEQNTLTQAYTHFLVDYDPDLIVLAPGMENFETDPRVRLHPFGFIRWETMNDIATLNPYSHWTGINATTQIVGGLKVADVAQKMIVAVADEAYPDTSRFAFVACGDIAPIRGESSGYRELLLCKLLKPGYTENDVYAHWREDLRSMIGAPNRHQLAKMILNDHQFPLSGAINILKASYELQRFMIMQPTFINLTTDYKGLAKNITSTRWSPSPAMVVLVSSTFTLEEAILFWNLRAGDVPVAWLPLSELELDLKTVVSWLIKYLGGLLPALRAVPEVIFACPQDQVAHLQGKLTSQQLPQTWSFVPYDNLISYNYVRPFIKQEYVLVAGDDLSSTFVPPLPEEIRFEEMYAITMKWDGLMLPQDQKLIHDCVSQEEANYTVISRPLPQFRVTKDRWLRVQADAKIPIRFNKPSPEQIFQSLFSAAGFSHVEANDKAKYQLDFIHRAGSLEHAASYLTTQPYRKLFEILSDKKNRSRLAWRLKNPPGRLALPHHLLLSIVRGEPLSEKTEEFLRLSDHLPEEILSLLGREILERGFLLKCASCSFDAWYPVEKVGQRFECGRCFQTQVYRTNPAWVYKLREVVFQGFEQNIEIPLLALDYLRQKSSYYFKWLPEPNIIWSEHGKKKTRNLDILCMCDGKLYIGEAKNNDEIDADQMSFYESLTRRLHIDGLVFATSQPRWKTGVKTRIDQLKAKFDGVVLELTASELYPGVSTTL